jgi:hypothetical protein
MDDDRLTDLGPSGGGGYDAALPIVKPLPAARFRVHGSNAEMRWEVMRGQGFVVPSADFFVRNHTSTPLIDAGSWSLGVFGTGLRGSVPAGRPVRFSYRDLLDLPTRTVVCAIECAGNGRSFFAAQQGQPVPSTPWRLGAIGVAAWRGVPLSVVLERAGITREAVDVMPSGLDPDLVMAGVNYGRVRRRTPRGADHERLPAGAGSRGLHRTRTPPHPRQDRPQTLAQLGNDAVSGQIKRRRAKRPAMTLSVGVRCSDRVQLGYGVGGQGQGRAGDVLAQVGDRRGTRDQHDVRRVL